MKRSSVLWILLIVAVLGFINLSLVRKLTLVSTTIQSSERKPEPTQRLTPLLRVPTTFHQLSILQTHAEDENLNENRDAQLRSALTTPRSLCGSSGSIIPKRSPHLNSFLPQQQPSAILQLAFTIQTILNQRIPEPPCLTNDNHFIILSAQINVHFSSISFVLLHNLEKHMVQGDKWKDWTGEPHEARFPNLWCIFEEGSISQVHGLSYVYISERSMSLFCSLPAKSERLFLFKKKLEVLLVEILANNETRIHAKATVSSQSPTGNYTLALCSSPITNRGEALAEWFEYYKYLGVDHIFFYEKISEDNTKQILSKYVEEGFVSVYNWTLPELHDEGRSVQIPAMYDCLYRARVC